MAAKGDKKQSFWSFLFKMIFASILLFSTMNTAFIAGAQSVASKAVYAGSTIISADQMLMGDKKGK